MALRLGTEWTVGRACDDLGWSVVTCRRNWLRLVIGLLPRLRLHYSEVRASEILVIVIADDFAFSVVVDLVLGGLVVQLLEEHIVDFLSPPQLHSLRLRHFMCHGGFLAALSSMVVVVGLPQYHKPLMILLLGIDLNR